MHNTADHKPTTRATCQMQRSSLLHVQVFYQPPLRKVVHRQLYTASKTCPDNSRFDPSIETLETLSAMDFSKAIHRILIPVLSAHGQERRVRLQARLDEEERGAGCSAEHARCSTGEDVDAKGLDFGVFEDGRGEALAEGLVEA